MTGFSPSPLTLSPTLFRFDRPKKKGAKKGKVAEKKGKRGPLFTIYVIEMNPSRVRVNCLSESSHSNTQVFYMETVICDVKTDVKIPKETLFAKEKNVVINEKEVNYPIYGQKEGTDFKF